MRQAAREEELEVEDADKFMRDSEENSEEGRNNRRGRGRGRGKGRGQGKARSKGDDSSKAPKDDDRSKAVEEKVLANSPSKPDKETKASPKDVTKGSPFFERQKLKRAMTRKASMSSLEVNPPTEPSPKKPRRAARKSKAKRNKSPERKDLGKEFEAAAEAEETQKPEENGGQPAPKRARPTPNLESC